jgi:hypothetical protein
MITFGRCGNIQPAGKDSLRTTAARPQNHSLESLPLYKSVSDVRSSEFAILEEYARTTTGGESMRIITAISVMTLLLGGFGTCLAQTTPGTAGQSSQTSRTTTPHATTRIPEYKTEADAKAHCGTDHVAWANTRSHVLHAPGSRYYGKTSHGAYVCESMAMKGGYHQAKESSQ